MLCAIFCAVALIYAFNWLSIVIKRMNFLWRKQLIWLG